MIFFDDNGLPSDETLDVGDSAVRISILTAISVFPLMFIDLLTYEIEPGTWVRHPKHKTWSNPKNFTRDQLLMIVWALHKAGEYKAIRRIFWSRFKAFPWFLGLITFAQSVERDVPGSKKMLWPHSNWKDSIPTNDTFPMKWSWKRFKFEPIIETFVSVDNKVWEAEHKLGDWADPLLPNHTGMMILGGKMWWFYWWIPFAYVFHFIALKLHSSSDHYEENQMIAECDIFNTYPLLCEWKPHWIENSFLYWADRNEIEYHDSLVNYVKRKVGLR